MKLLRKEHVASNKDRLTVEWFSQTVAELRAELAEVQEASSNTSRILQQRTVVQEQIGELQDDFHNLRLSLEALKMRQENTERVVKELRAEATQSGEELRRSRIDRGSSKVGRTFIRYLYYPRFCVEWTRKLANTYCRNQLTTSKIGSVAR